MRVYITEIRMRGHGRGHEAISHTFWNNRDNDTGGWVTTVQMVRWLGLSSNEAWVESARGAARVEVVSRPGEADHLQARDKRNLSPHLLALPGGTRKKV